MAELDSDSIVCCNSRQRKVIISIFNINGSKLGAFPFLPVKFKPDRFTLAVSKLNESIFELTILSGLFISLDLEKLIKHNIIISSILCIPCCIAANENRTHKDKFPGKSWLTKVDSICMPTNLTSLSDI